MLTPQTAIRIRRLRQIIISLPQSIYFNLRYLPLSQAIHLPILLAHPQFRLLYGKLRIMSNQGVR